MEKQYLPYSFSFDEELLAYELFHLKENKIKSVINSQIRNKSFNLIFAYVSRYLLHVHRIEPVVVRQMLRKYAVIIAYMYLESSPSLNLKGIVNPKISNMISNMSVELLLKDIKIPGLFGRLYNDIEYHKNLKLLINKLNRQDKNKEEDIYKLLRGEYNFFSPNTELIKFSKNESMKRFDLIVSEEMMNNEFEKFEFELEYDSFIRNIIPEGQKKLNVTFATIWTGYLIHSCIKSNDFTCSKIHDVINNNKFVLCSCDKRASIPNTHLMFMFDEVNGKNIERENIDLKKVSYFRFTYNGKKYDFTRSGIKLSTIK